MQILGYFISLLQFFGQKYLPYANIWLFYFISAIFLANLANANFFQNQKSHVWNKNYTTSE
jgi:hypothetical protein